MPPVGHRDELAAVQRVLDGIILGRGGRLFLTGPSGAGKTALLEAAAELAQAKGFGCTVRWAPISTNSLRSRMANRIWS